MRNFNDKKKPHDHDGKASFNREDSKNAGRRGIRHSSDSTEGQNPFIKDKRPRIHKELRSEKIERRSYNPNFTKDNKLKDGGEAYSSKYNDNTEQDTYSANRHSESRYKTVSSDTGSSYRRTGKGPNRDSFEKPSRHVNDYSREDAKNNRGSRTHSGEYDKNNHGRGAKDGRRNNRSQEKTYRKGGGRTSMEYPRFNAPKQSGPMRLNRFVAISGICSRREADDFIKAGVVSVNGKIVTELGTKVGPSDVVRFNDEVIHGEKKVYIVMNKPKGYVTTLDDPHADKTVIDLLNGACKERVYPVGRLDKNSVGVLLITNDGDMTRLLTHPSSQKRKVYQVSLDKALTRADMDKILEGIVLEDGEIAADDISYVKENKKEVGIEIHSGRNRIVRRIFESLGYTVKKLDRVYFAGLTKKGLKRGSWRFLTPLEVSCLKSGKFE